MKITNLKGKIAAMLVSAGLLAPSAAYAAMLNTNLVINPSFEDVDLDTVIGGYDARLVLDWEGGGGAYAFTQGYDNGGPLDGGGERYFSPNSIDGPISQDIDVSDGPSATLIATGAAEYSLSAFFSSYAGDGDYGVATIEFLEDDEPLEDDFIEDLDTTTWTQETLPGTVPVGTTTVRVTLDGVALSGGPDGYMDLIDFQIVGDAGPILQAGDADQDLDFDQLDLVQVQIAGKYLSGQDATWGEGDWNGAPGGSPQDPPAGDGRFDQLDIIAALNADVYLSGPYFPALAPLAEATFGNGFDAASFANVAPTGLSESLLVGDHAAVGSLASGGELSGVDLVPVPEPSTIVLLGMGLLGAGWYLCGTTRRRA